MLLGRWWETLLRAPGAFGAEYQNLRLGTALGVTVTVVFVLAMVFLWRSFYAMRIETGIKADARVA